MIFIRCVLKELHDNFSNNIAVLFRSLVLSLLHLLQEMKVALDTRQFELFVLVVGIYSGPGRGTTDHDILQDGTNLRTMQGARPADTQ